MSSSPRRQPPRVALVTGAAKRVGRAIALALAEAGCDVAVHYRSSDKEAAKTAADVRSLGRRACLVQGNLEDDDTPARLIHATVRELGGLSILVNNAAVFGRMRMADFDPAGWDRELRINLTAPAALCHHALPHLHASDRAAIVNLCDISAERPWPEHTAYCVSKAGLVCLTKALARELAPRVRVNGVAPGIAEFPPDYDHATRDALIAKVPLRRVGSPQAVAETVRFLAMDAAYITGQIVNVDGGRSIV